MNEIMQIYGLLAEIGIVILMAIAVIRFIYYFMNNYK